MGYLYALEDMVDTADEQDIIAMIIERAKEIEVTPITTTYPTYPWITYTTPTTCDTTNIKWSSPTDWSVTTKKDNPTNFTVVK
jgi:hypothetical protein